MVPWRLAGALLLAASTSPAAAETVNHFRGFPPPPEEARILALTGVREFCCHYEIAPSTVRFLGKLPGPGYQADFDLFAEVYAGTTCTARYRLALAVDAFTDPAKARTGIISIGWNEEQHELTSVLANDQFYSPWHASMHLPGFSAVDAHFFADAKAEQRHSASGGDYVLYPVLGICGERTYKIPGGYEGIDDAQKLLGLYKFVKAKSAVIIYLYSSSLGDEPDLKFDPHP